MTEKDKVLAHYTEQLNQTKELSLITDRINKLDRMTEKRIIDIAELLRHVTPKTEKELYTTAVIVAASDLTRWQAERDTLHKLLRAEDER